MLVDVGAGPVVGHGRIQRLRADAAGATGSGVSVSQFRREVAWLRMEAKTDRFVLQLFFCSDNCIRPRRLCRAVTREGHVERTTRDGKYGGRGRATSDGGATGAGGAGGAGGRGRGGGRAAYLRFVVLVRGGLLVLVTARAPRQCGGRHVRHVRVVRALGRHGAIGWVKRREVWSAGGLDARSARLVTVGRVIEKRWGRPRKKRQNDRQEAERRGRSA